MSRQRMRTYDIFIPRVQNPLDAIGCRGKPSISKDVCLRVLVLVPLLLYLSKSMQREGERLLE